MDSIRVALKEALIALEKGAREIKSCAIIRRDGIMLESTLPLSMGTVPLNKIDLKRGTATVARLGALLANTSDVVSGELGRGNLQQLVVDTPEGKMVLLGAGPEVILLCHVKELTPIVMLNISGACAKIKKILA